MAADTFSLSLVLKESPFIFILMQSNPGLAQPLFTISIGPGEGDSSCTFGLIPPQYNDDVVYTPVDSSQRSWTVEVTRCSFGNQYSSLAFNAQIDTGTPTLQLPRDIVDLYFSRLGDDARFLNPLREYVYKCDVALPDLSLTIGLYMTTILGDFLTGPKAQGLEGCTYKHLSDQLPSHMFS